MCITLYLKKKSTVIKYASIKIGIYNVILKFSYFSNRDQLATGEWLSESQMVKVTRPGKFWHHMGVETDIGKCLYPEEAVYLIDTVRDSLRALLYYDLGLEA